MKLSKFSQPILFSILVAGMAVGCKHPNKIVTNVNRPGATTPAVAPKTTESLAPTLRPDGDPLATELKDPNGLLPAGPGHQGWTSNPDLFKDLTVHFEYDSSVIRPVEKPHVEALASQLKSNPDWALRIDGHCDERGTEEYNRSLGERRALALREELARLGVEPARVDTMSFGNDKPLVTGHDEISWSQNRRGEFVQLTQPK